MSNWFWTLVPFKSYYITVSTLWWCLYRVLFYYRHWFNRQSRHDFFLHSCSV